MDRIPLEEGPTFLCCPSRQLRSYFQLHFADEVLTASGSGMRGEWSWGACERKAIQYLVHHTLAGIAGYSTKGGHDKRPRLHPSL